MEKQDKFAIFQDEDPMMRIHMLESNAVEVDEEFGYQRNLDDDEIREEASKFAGCYVDLARLQDEKKRLVAEINEKIKAKQRVADRHLELIRTRREEVVEKVFVLPDFEAGSMRTYNCDGILVAERPMRQAERQLTIGAQLNQPGKSYSVKVS